jgi:hypothetical protein
MPLPILHRIQKVIIAILSIAQVVADKAKEYGMNKLTPFTGD